MIDEDHELLEQQLKAERFGAPVLVTEVRCFGCGGLLVKNRAGFWVHVESGLCSTPTVAVEERKPRLA